MSAVSRSGDGAFRIDPAAKERGQGRLSRLDLYCAALCYHGLPLSPLFPITLCPSQLCASTDVPEPVCSSSILVMYPAFETLGQRFVCLCVFCGCSMCVTHQAILIIFVTNLAVHHFARCSVLCRTSSCGRPSIYCEPVLIQSPDLVGPSKIACICSPLLSPLTQVTVPEEL